jgi:hypothetical protein
MKLKEQDQLLFRKWVTNYFSEDRKLRSKKILEKLQKDVPSLVKNIKKVAKKNGEVSYIGRCLLPKFKKEGWLIYKSGFWRVKVTPERCAYCFKPLNEVYLIDNNENHFCNDDCLEELGDFQEGFNPYWDEYRMMYSNFRDMYPDIKKYKELKNTLSNIDPLTHIELINFIKDIEQILYDSEYQEIVIDEGGDGSFSWEVYRMFNILKDELEELIEVEGQVLSYRVKEKKFYSIIVDHNYLAGEGKKNKLLQKFIKKNSKYLMENCSHTWITSDREKRGQWYDELNKGIDGYFHYKNYYQCSNCEAVVEDRYTRKAIDDYNYCEECWEEVESSGGFNWREEY